MLYFIGLGLYDYKDISLKGMDVLQEVEIIYAESYTARLFGEDLSDLEKHLNQEIIILSREQVEEENIILKSAQDKDVAFLCAGDPLVATTHSDLLIEAKKNGLNTRVVHGSSILSAAPGIAGLQAYKFGKVTTIPRVEKNYFPHSPYEVIRDNLAQGLHTLVLLDIKTHEDYYMTANEGIKYLMQVDEERDEKIFKHNPLVVVVARAGAPEPLVRADKISRLVDEDFGGPLHCLIIPGNLHFLEAEALSVLAGAPEELLKVGI